MNSSPLSLNVIDVQHDTADAVVLTLEATDGRRVPFAHGQHLTLRREFDGVEIRRCYSICAAAPDGALRIGIKRVDGGTFSTWATTDLAAGATIEAFAPSGRFTHEIHPDQARRYVLVAAGSGITPIYSIAATVLEREPHAAVTLLQIDRSSSSAMLVDEVEQLRSRFLGRLRLWRQYSREPTDTGLEPGRLDTERLRTLIRNGVLDAAPNEVFVCGPEGLVGAVTDVYLQSNILAEHIHDELFTSDQVGRARQQPLVAATAQPSGSGAVVLHGRETPFDIYDGDTILQAVERVRADVPYSCRAGVCSTCRARLVEGSADMAITHGLVPGEEEAGYVLTCQAEPATTNVRVDYDG